MKHLRWRRYTQLVFLISAQRGLSRNPHIVHFCISAGAEARARDDPADNGMKTMEALLESLHNALLSELVKCVLQESTSRLFKILSLLLSGLLQYFCSRRLALAA